MQATEPLIRNVSDTALWVAVYRAWESERPNALFRDPFAKRLAGERGEQIAATMPWMNRAAWAFVMRTVLFDSFLEEKVEQGADMVVNLAAGLDARPYRMRLPSSLQWIEVDLPALIAYKEEVLRGETPVCALERVPLDLVDVSARRQLFADLGRRSGNAVVITEGLTIYLTADEVRGLAEDLAAPPSFRHWIIDLSSPGLVRRLQRAVGSQLDQARAPLKFAPEEGPEFFSPYGWHPKEVRSMFREAARAKILPLWMRLLAKLPEPSGRQGLRPWLGVCLLEKQQASR